MWHDFEAIDENSIYFMWHDFEAIDENSIAHIIALPSTLKGEFNYKTFVVLQLVET